MASAAYDVAVHSGGGAAGRRSRAKASFTRSAGRMRAVVFRACKLRGLALEAKAYKAIASVLRQEDDPQEALSEVLETLQAHIQKRGGGGLVTVGDVEAVVTMMSRDDEDQLAERLQVLPAASTPRFDYNTTTQKFARVTRSPLRHSSAFARAAMHRERFSLLHQRLMRHKQFAPPKFGSKQNYMKLTNIEMLPSSKGTQYVLGMLGRTPEDALCLEDLNATVAISLKAVKQHSVGMFTLGSIVLVQGAMGDGVFHVEMIGHPPAEVRAAALKAMDVLDPFDADTTAQEISAARALASEAEDQFIMLSDVHLDNPVVVESLRKVLGGFEEVGMAPALIVLMGNFMSRPFGQTKDDRATFTRLMQDLADLIASYPGLAAGSHFVLVPGPNDPGASSALPQTRIPKIFTKAMEEHVSTVTFTTNPCRVRFFNKEIVLFRQDLMAKMRRQSLLPITEADHAPHEHLTRTVCDQGHLCPLPLATQPIHWDLDFALRLYPLPDVVVLADTCEPFACDYEETACLNPGSFPVDGSFMVYMPGPDTAQPSAVEAAS